MLKLEKLQLFLRGQPLFAPLTLSIQPGEVVTLMGRAAAANRACSSFSAAR